MIPPEQQQRIQDAYFESFKNKDIQKPARAARAKPKKQPETLVRNACEEAARQLGCFLWVNRTGMYSPRPGVKIPYGYPGSSDLIGCTPSGKMLCIETKYSSGQSDRQKAFQASIERRGGIYILAYSADDILKRKGEILG